MKNILCSICLLIILFFLPVYGQNDQMKSDWANLKKYAKANEMLASTEAGKNRVVFMGNSITEAWAKIDSSFFTENDYIDRGISGQTSPQMLLRFRQDVINLKPAVVVILAGTNDIAENTGPITLKDILGNIISMTQLAAANNIKVILSSVLPAYDFPWHRGLEPADKIVNLNKMIKSYCEKNNIVFVDYYKKMADERNGLDKKYSQDGVHPNLAGYKIMEPLIKKAIENVLK